MASTQPINNQRLTGSQTFNFTPPPAGTQWAAVTIDRTVNQGLNTLPTTATLEIAVDRSTDGGVTWTPAAGITCQGGPLVTKGVTMASELLVVGMDPEDTGYRVNTVASQPVRVTGQVDYTP